MAFSFSDHSKTWIQPTRFSLVSHVTQEATSLSSDLGYLRFQFFLLFIVFIQVPAQLMICPKCMYSASVSAICTRAAPRRGRRLMRQRRWLVLPGVLVVDLTQRAVQGRRLLATRHRIQLRRDGECKRSAKSSPPPRAHLGVERSGGG